MGQSCTWREMAGSSFSCAAKILNLNFSAKGIETEEHGGSLNCSEMQGYFFKQTAAADEPGKFLDNPEGIYRENLP